METFVNSGFLINPPLPVIKPFHCFTIETTSSQLLTQHPYCNAI